MRGVRAGLPSTVKESLAKSAEFNVYVRDRKPFVRFTGKAYVLPRTGQQGIPLVSVNAETIEAEVGRRPEVAGVLTRSRGDFDGILEASDLIEGTLNNVDRPPVRGLESRRILFPGEAVPHFNEVDECAGLDALVTYRLWRELGFAPENTLHDLRWGQHYHHNGLDAYVWVLLISGAAPPAHFVGGWKGAVSERQPPMYFRLGGGTLKGVSKPGHIVWSRIFIMEGKLHCDLGVARVVELPRRETERRWRETTPQWPIMHAVLYGVSRDQMMAQHKSNHVQVVYSKDAAAADLTVRLSDHRTRGWRAHRRTGGACWCCAAWPAWRSSTSNGSTTRMTMTISSSWN